MQGGQFHTERVISYTIPPALAPLAYVPENTSSPARAAGTLQAAILTALRLM